MKRISQFLVLLLFAFTSCKTGRMATQQKEASLVQPQQQVDQPLKDPDKQSEVEFCGVVHLHTPACRQ